MDIEDKTPIENLERKSALASKNQYFMISYLVSQTHIPRDPVRLVNLRGFYFLPDVFWNIIAFDGVYDVLLIDSASECEDIFVHKSWQSYSRPCDSQRINLFPLIFLYIVNFTNSIHQAVEKCGDYINEPFNGTQTMISMGVKHWCLLI